MLIYQNVYLVTDDAFKLFAIMNELFLKREMNIVFWHYKRILRLQNFRSTFVAVYAYSTPWWRHQMETFPALVALCEGNPPVTSDRLPGQWRKALMFSFISALTNGWANNRDAVELRRHRAHYDVINAFCHSEMHPLLWFSWIKISQQLS